MDKVNQANTAVNAGGAFYIGRVFHQRTVPKHHEFTYPLYMTWLDLDQVDSLTQQHWWLSWRRFAPLQFKPTDYLRDFRKSRTLANHSAVEQHSPAALKSLVLQGAACLGAQLSSINKVWFLGSLRSFGVYFSPVNFFFLYADDKPCYLLAEVSNTPWNERHLYLVDVEAPSSHEKAFHVSPFMPMNMQYRWRIQAPTDTTQIVIESVQKTRVFMAIFAGKRHGFTRKNVTKVLCQWPMVTLSMLRGIYWQAAKIFAKGIPYVAKVARQHAPKGTPKKVKK